MKIYLIRHAQSSMNAAGRLTGWSDIDLSDEGMCQAESSKNFFKSLNVDKIYASTLLRAYKTARLIFGNDAKIEQMDELKEINIGAFEMKTHEELLSAYPKIYRDWLNDPTLSTPPEGENVYDYYNRVVSGIERIISENDDDKTIAVVSHGGVVRCLAVYTLNMKVNDLWRVKVDNLSLSCIEFSGDKKAVTLLNDTCHLKRSGS